MSIIIQKLLKQMPNNRIRVNKVKILTLEWVISRDSIKDISSNISSKILELPTRQIVVILLRGGQRSNNHISWLC